MTNWYYYNESGKRVGPMPMATLKAFSQQGSITRETLVEDEAGRSFPAEQVKGLFPSIPKPPPEVVYEMTPPPPGLQPTAPNPFTAPAPDASNPFTATHLPPDTYPVMPPSSSEPVTEKIAGFFKKVVIFCITVSLLCVAGGVAGEFYTRHLLKEATVKAIEKGLEDQPWEKTGISITLADWVHIFTDQVLLEYSATIKATEGRYESVSTKEALEILGITDNEREYQEAVRKFLAMSGSLSDLRKPIRDDFTGFRFHAVRVPSGSEKTITGNADLTREAIWQTHWQCNVQMTLPDEELTPLSDLSPGTDRLDDDKTKNAVNKIVQDRKDFIAKVNETIAEREKQETTVKAAINEELQKLFLGITGNPSINWTNMTLNKSAGASFSVKAKETKPLYQSVDVEVGWEMLGNPNRYEKEFDVASQRIQTLPDTFKTKLTEQRKTIPELPSRFFKPLGSEEITLEGTVELTKSGNENWDVAIQTPPVAFLTDPDLKPGDYKLNEPAKIQSIIQARKSLVDRLKPITDFDEFSKPGNKYEGKFEAFNDTCRVIVIFNQNEGNSNKGTITFDSRVFGKHSRPFSVDVNVSESAAQMVVTVKGNVEQYHLPMNKFLEARGLLPANVPQGHPARNFYDTMRRYTEIDIRVTDKKVDFTISPPVGGEIPRGEPQKLELILEGWPPTSERENGVLLLPVAIKLDDAIRESGFKDVRDFAWYGNITLRDDYDRKVKIHNNWDPIDTIGKETARKDRDEAWKRIEEKRNQNAQKTFYHEYKYTYSEYDIVPGPPASFVMRISSAIDFRGLRHEIVSLPPIMQDVECKLAEFQNFTSSIRLTIEGNNGLIMALTRNNNDYQAKVFFTNLRPGSGYYASPTASTQKIEIFNVR